MFVDWEVGRCFVGTTGRGIAGEKKYNSRWLAVVICVPLLLGLGAAAWMFGVSGQMPAQLASHWGSNGVDGYSSLWGLAAIAVLVCGGTGALLGGLGVASRGQSLVLARIFVGVGIGGGFAMAGLALATVAGQLGLTDPSQAVISAPVVWTGVVLGVAVGGLAGWLYRPGAVDRSPSPGVQSVAAELQGKPVSSQAKAMAANGETLAIGVSMGSWKWLLSLGVGAVIAACLFFVSPWLSLLGVLAAVLLWAFCQGTAVIGPDGVKVMVSGFFKLMPATYQEIHSAAVQDIKAMDFGGWGYRLGGGSTGFIMGSGPALVLETGFHQRYVISMPDAETAGRACSLVTAYLQITPVSGSAQ
jgi:hypothetical protein